LCRARDALPTQSNLLSGFQDTVSCRRSGGNDLPEQSHYALSGGGDTLSWYEEDTVSRPANTLSRGGDNLCDRPDDLPGIPDSLS
jgi:hypothetical protein